MVIWLQINYSADKGVHELHSEAAGSWQGTAAQVWSWENMPMLLPGGELLPQPLELQLARLLS